MEVINNRDKKAEELDNERENFVGAEGDLSFDLKIIDISREAENRLNKILKEFK